MIKPYELRDIIQSDLNDFKASDDWEEFVLIETVSESHNIIHVNFVEIDEDGWIDNKYKITIESL